MKTVSETKAVELFAQLMTPFITSPPRPAATLVEKIIGFYRDVRVRGADERLMLEWGASPPHLLDGFTDLRKADPEWDDVKYQWVGLTRQIQADGGDDDTALSAFLYFGKATGKEPSSFIEFEGLDGLESQVSRFLQKPYVAKLLATRPSRVTAFASEVG